MQCSGIILKPSPLPRLWKNCLPQNQSLVPKRLETAAKGFWGVYKGRCSKLPRQSVSESSVEFPKDRRTMGSFAKQCFYKENFISFRKIKAGTQLRLAYLLTVNFWLTVLLGFLVWLMKKLDKIILLILKIATKQFWKMGKQCLI